MPDLPRFITDPDGNYNDDRCSGICRRGVPKTHAFYNAILWGAQKKITTGYTSGPNKGKFMINDNCSRGQIVTFLYRAK